MRFLKRKRGFYVKRSITFKTGPLDMIVTIGALIVFIHALLFGSFKVMYLPEKEINVNQSTGINISKVLIEKTGNLEEPFYEKTKRYTMISLQLFIAPIVLCYEMLLLCLEGKHRGRYLPWSFWYRMLEYKIILKMREGKQLTKEYMDRKKDGR